MLGGWSVFEQEAGGQQAQVGSLRAGARGVLKRKSSKGKVIGLRRRWKALLWVLDFVVEIGLYRWCGSTLGRKRE
jgi:hypothetical protein